MGLQVPPGMDEEVPVSGTGWGGRGALPGVAARDSAQQGDAYLCGVDQSGPCAYVDSDSAVFIGIAGDAIQYMKGKSSHKLLSEFARLRKRYWGQHLWARGYRVYTSGNVSDEVWQRYIKEQKAPEPDDDFKVI